jgi:hypothetical protein
MALTHRENLIVMYRVTQSADREIGIVRTRLYSRLEHLRNSAVRSENARTKTHDELVMLAIEEHGLELTLNALALTIARLRDEFHRATDALLMDVLNELPARLTSGQIASCMAEVTGLQEARLSALVALSRMERLVWAA